MFGIEKTRLCISVVVLSLLAGTPSAFAQRAPLGGLSQLYVWPEEPRNLIANPSFELVHLGDPSGWTLASPKVWILDGQQRHSGRRSLRLKNSNLARYAPRAIHKLRLEPGWYNLRAYVKTDRAGSNNARAGGRIRVTQGGLGGSTDLARGTMNWTRFERTNVLVGSGSSGEVIVEAYRKPSGNLFFDDLALHRLTPPFLEGFLLYPNYRGLLFSDRSQILRVAVTARPEVLGRRAGDFVVRLALQDSSGATIASSDRTVPAGSPTTISLDASRASVGRYLLRLAALDAKTKARIFEYPPYEIVKRPGTDRSTLRTWVDADNTLVVDGQRRFVLGIYDTSGRSALPSGYEPRISKIAEGNFNLYLNYWLGAATRPEIAALTTTLRKYGMSYLHTANAWYESNPNWSDNLKCGSQTSGALGEDGYASCKARELGELPGLAGYYTADELKADRIAPVFDQYRLLRNGDPDGVTFIALNRPKELGRWRDAADVVGTDPYAIFNIPLGKLAPLEMVLDWTETAGNSVHSSRPVWTVIQFFKFGQNGHWPTYDELRTMSYMAIIGGAKGLFYWSYGANGLSWVTDPRQREEYWRRLVKVTTELRSLEPVLLAPDSPNVLSSVSTPRVQVMTKDVGNARYVFAVNRTKDNLRASFKLSRAGSRANVRGEGRSLAVSAGVFTDTFKPYGVHVYQIANP